MTQYCKDNQEHQHLYLSIDNKQYIYEGLIIFYTHTKLCHMYYFFKIQRMLFESLLRRYTILTVVNTHFFNVLPSGHQVQLLANQMVNWPVLC